MIEHAPQSLEGAAAIAALMQPGAWRRAGMTGAVVGVDAEAALSRVNLAGVNVAVARRLVARGEAGLILGSGRLMRSDSPARHEGTG
mgnify:CR=1 FL=1